MKDEDLDLSGAYAAGAVTDSERAAHEALMRDDAELAEETRSLTEAVSELSKTSEQPAPEHLRANVLNAIKNVRPLPAQSGDEPAEEPSSDGTAEPVDEVNEPVADVDEPVDLTRRRARRRGAWLGAIAAAAAAVVAVVIVLGQRDNASMNQAEAVISASDVSSQTATVDDWSATLYLSPSQDKAVLASDQMPDAPAGKDFQVWLVHDDDSFTSAGLMPRTGGDGQQYVVTGVEDQVQAIAVSEEPAGGSDKPTTPVLIIELS